jgi:hypothetical protein
MLNPAMEEILEEEHQVDNRVSNNILVLNSKTINQSFINHFEAEMK